jgi:hypothetical protein
MKKFLLPVLLVFAALLPARAGVAILQLEVSTNLSTNVFTNWMPFPLRSSDVTGSGTLAVPVPEGVTNAFFRMNVSYLQEPVPPVNVGVRLSYFYAEGSGDPAYATNPHVIRQASSTNGTSFSSAVDIYSADNLVDPDVFRVATNFYGLLVTDFASTNLIYATSTNIAGPYSTVPPVSPRNVTQSSAIEMGGAFRVFGSGIFAYEFNPATGVLGTNIPSLGLSAFQIGKTNGICADPSVIRLADGRYRMYFKYAAPGAMAPQHQLWQITSSDASGTSWDTNTVSYLTNGSVPGAVRDGQNILLYFVSFDPALSPNNSIAVGVSTNQGTNFSYYPVFLDGMPISGAYDPSANLLTD